MRIILTLLLLMFFAYDVSAQAGTVYLKDAAGNTLSTHSSIQLAYDAIPIPLTQAYTIAIDSGYLGRTPYEHFPIRFIAKDGASATHTITMRANRRDYWLTRILARTDSTELMIFDGASWIIIDGERTTPDIEFPNGLALRGTPNISSPRASSPLIRFVNGASYNTIRYCEIYNGRRQPGRNDEPAILFDTSAAVTGNNYNVIEHCLFDTENGLKSKGSLTKPNEHNIIRNNLFDQAYVNALTVQEGTGALAFTNNEIYAGYFFSSTNLSSAVNLIRITGFSDTLKINGNTFWLMRPSDGSSADSALNAILFAPSVPIPPGSLCMLANNYISTPTGYGVDHNDVIGPYYKDAAPGPVTGIDLHTSGMPANVLVAHNTIRLGSTPAPDITGKLYSAALRQHGNNSSSIRVVNNIFHNFRQGGGSGTHHLVLDLQDTTGIALDYNIYHGTDTFAAIGVNTYQDFSRYHATVAAQDVHSYDSTVVFEAIGTYLLSMAMAGQPFMTGTLLPEIPMDKNGNQRILPYRGADELTTTCDTGINYSGIYALGNAACAGNLVFLQYAERSWFAPVLPAGGLIHQWQSWEGNAAGFSDIPGAHSTELIITQNLITTYRVKDSCISSGHVTYTNQVTIPITTATVVLDSLSASANGAPQITNFVVHMTGTATSFNWNFGDGTTGFSSSPTIDHYYNNPGIYTVTVYTDEACGDSVSLTFDSRVPEAINNPQLSSGGLSVYPNPADNLLQIKSATPLGKLTITDLPGRIVLSQAGIGNAASISVAALPAGIYLLHTGNGQVARFTVQH